MFLHIILNAIANRIFSLQGTWLEESAWWADFLLYFVYPSVGSAAFNEFN